MRRSDFVNETHRELRLKPCQQAAIGRCRAELIQAGKPICQLLQRVFQKTGRKVDSSMLRSKTEATQKALHRLGIGNVRQPALKGFRRK
jgi:hypothetical protein